MLRTFFKRPTEAHEYVRDNNEGHVSIILIHQNSYFGRQVQLFFGKKPRTIFLCERNENCKILKGGMYCGETHINRLRKNQ